MPAKIDAAFHSLRAAGAVLVSAEQRGGQIVHAAFQALQGGVIRVLNPYDPVLLKCPVACVSVRRADTDEIVARCERRYREPVEWAAEQGVVYFLETR